MWLLLTVFFLNKLYNHQITTKYLVKWRSISGFSSSSSTFQYCNLRSCCGKAPCLIGKSFVDETCSSMFHSSIEALYVKLPEGNPQTLFSCWPTSPMLAYRSKLLTKCFKVSKWRALFCAHWYLMFGNVWAHAPIQPANRISRHHLWLANMIKWGESHPNHQ